MVTREKVRELRRLLFNGEPVDDPSGLKLIAVCDSWLRKDSEIKRLRKRMGEIIDIYEKECKRLKEQQ
ncbi:MAG TPA: hypothetical protein VF762_14290 [Blastocatellia bacterium]|jgi:hypothetical protein